MVENPVEGNWYHWYSPDYNLPNPIKVQVVGLCMASNNQGPSDELGRATVWPSRERKAQVRFTIPGDPTEHLGIAIYEDLYEIAS